MTPYYDEGGIMIYHGDCADVLPTLDRVDLVFTSPPYNLGSMPWKPLGHWTPGKGSSGGHGAWPSGITAENGADYDAHDDAMPWAEYVAWQRSVLALCWDCLTDVGAIFYNHKPRVVGERVWLPLELTEGLPLRQIVVWSRSGGHNFMRTAYTPTHEWLLVLAKPEWRLTTGSVGDVWQVPPECGSAHPAPFPLTLPARAIETTGAAAVLDPFMGSGTTLRAAKNAGRRAIGIDKSERYCEMAALRLGQEVLAL